MVFNNTDKPVVKLIYRDGNAFAIMGACMREAEKAKFPKEKIDKMLQEMQSGDYDHLLQVVMQYFDVV